MIEKEVRLIQSIQRAFNIIDCFSKKEPELTLPQISEKLNLNINTTRGIVNTLVANDYLMHDPDKNSYTLGLIYITKADLVMGKNIERLRRLAAPYLKDIANRFQISALFQVITNNNIITIDNISPDNSHYILNSRIGITYELNATASGKLFLQYMDESNREHYLTHTTFVSYTANTLVTKESIEAELDTIKFNGYSTEFEEIGLGIDSIAVPILKDSDTLYGTVSVIASSSVMESIKEELLEPLRNCAGVITANLNLSAN